LNEGGLEYDQFRKLVQRAEAICDPQRSNTTARDRRERRTATVSVDDAGATLEASLDALDGAEVLEIFANFVDAEFRADWDDAVARLGDDVTPSHLARTDRQRQADALVTIFRTAAGAPAESDASCEPTVTILLDERTFRDTLTEFGVLPRRDRDPFDDPGLFWSQRRCETTTGVVIDPRTATQAALDGHVRWMMVDRLGTPLAVTSRQRYFRGPARHAVMSISDRCIHPGCRRRAGNCQADHLDEHQHGGPTALGNGAPICARHNRFKSRTGYRPRRDHRGHWHLYDRHGNEVV
jgi:hypothetical protein